MAYSDADFIRDYNAALPGKFSLTGVQEGIVKFGPGPLLISAGPGSGKTECLVARALFLLLVVGMDPKAIMMTTFTRKAARGLKDRLNERLDILQKMNPKNQTIQDATIQGMRIGTIHSLAEEILADARSIEFNGMMVIDEIPLKMLLLNQSRDPYRPAGHPLREFCKDTFGGERDFTRQLISLYHHIIEDQIDLRKLVKEGGVSLVKSYHEFRNMMKADKRLDFALLLELFLRELSNGTLDSVIDQIEYVLVDEYQDTNPIQEDIFFGLAKKKNLCVVGDDDQALYRFRGASVECMVNFESECKKRWNKKAKRMDLVDNFRSHPRIVDFYETYMNSHPVLNQKHTRLRVNGQPPLGQKGPTLASHPALTLCSKPDQTQTDDEIAKVIAEMIATNVVQDPSQIAILSPTVDESTANGVGHLVRELESLGVPVYNPRGKDMVMTPEVMALFGMISHVIDPKAIYATELHDKHDKALIGWLDECRNQATAAMGADKDAADYMKKAHSAISKAPDDTAYALVGGIMIHILNLPTFSKIPHTPASAWRLAAATNWLEEYSLTPGKKNTPAFQSVFVKKGQIAAGSLKKFYKIGCSAFFNGRTPEHEDEDQIVTPGHVSVMTIHQAKGLEFDVVVVRGIKVRNKPRTTQKQHIFFAPLRSRPIKVHLTEEEMRDTDEFRAFYVAYSRAKHVLILHDPGHWKRIKWNRGYIDQDVAATHAYLTANPSDTAVI